jgi:hypothetical protein
VLYNNEKMLPRSYSIAGWPQWLCITNDTVCCITTTPTDITLSGMEFSRSMARQQFKNLNGAWA